MSCHMIHSQVITRTREDISMVHSAQQQDRDSPVGILGSTRVGLAELIGSKEVVQEFVILALPSVPIKENADPGYHTLKKQDGQRPDEC